MKKTMIYLSMVAAIYVIIALAFCSKVNEQPQEERTEFSCSEECDTCPNNFSFHLLPSNLKAFCYETSLKVCTTDGDSIYYGRANQQSNSIFTGFNKVCAGTSLEWCVWKNPALDSLFESCDTLTCLDATVWFGATNGDIGYFGNICTELEVGDTLCFDIGEIVCCNGLTINCIYEPDSTMFDNLECCTEGGGEFMSVDTSAVIDFEAWQALE